MTEFVSTGQIYETEIIAKPSFMMTGYINGETYEAALNWLGYWRESNYQQRLTVYINSEGTENLASAMAIAEGFMQSPNPLRTIVTGSCFSGAVLLAAAGNRGERHAFKSAEFMIHQVQIEGGGQLSVPDLVISTKTIESSNERFLKLLSLFTGKSVDKIKKDTRNDKYLDAYQAQRYGIIDHVAEWQLK